MRWTPSIVPKAEDQTVYLDDLGRNGLIRREAEVAMTDLETGHARSSRRAVQKSPPHHRLSIPPRVGRGTCQPISRISCTIAVIFRRAMCPFICRTLWIAMKADSMTSSSRFQFGPCERWLSSAGSQSTLQQPLRGLLEPRLRNVGREAPMGGL